MVEVLEMRAEEVFVVTALCYDTHAMQILAVFMTEEEAKVFARMQTKEWGRRSDEEKWSPWEETDWDRTVVPLRRELYFQIRKVLFCPAPQQMIFDSHTFRSVAAADTPVLGWSE